MLSPFFHFLCHSFYLLWHFPYTTVSIWHPFIKRHMLWEVFSCWTLTIQQCPAKSLEHLHVKHSISSSWIQMKWQGWYISCPNWLSNFSLYIFGWKRWDTFLWRRRMCGKARQRPLTWAVMVMYMPQLEFHQNPIAFSLWVLPSGQRLQPAWPHAFQACHLPLSEGLWPRAFVQ